jgi:putative ABC transport system ATP-binding protein
MIELNGIDKIFRLGDEDVHALKGVNLTINNGDYISIMGPSGSGKSTLLNVIALMDRPSQGDYFLNKRNITDLDDDELARVRRENFGFVFQSFHLIPRLTAAENIEIPLILSSVLPDERSHRVNKALESFKLTERRSHKPDQLSGGQMQRVAIARATIMGPSVILADEPTGNLDQSTGKQVVEILEQLNEQGVTLITVTHDKDLGTRAGRQLRLVDGEITQDTGPNS